MEVTIDGSAGAPGQWGGKAWESLAKRLWAARYDPDSWEPVRKEVFLLVRSWFRRLLRRIGGRK